MYQALYRKWRPRTFDDVVGQQHVTETLKNQIISGRLSHAYLFVGTRGTGKTSCAKILAKAVNCEHPENGNPCNKCRSCLGIEDGSIMDVVEMDAASNNGVDNVRALRDEAVFSPVVVKKRVYIVDEVHMLSASAFNALLKILEEPPEHLMFILATTELQKVPATILSRCQRHSFKRIEPVTLSARISYVANEENMKLEPNAADLLARLADGSLRDGLSLLDQCSGDEIITAESVLSAMGLAGNLRIAELLNSIADGDTGAALTNFGKMWSDGKAPATLLSELAALLRDILITKVAPKGGLELLSGGFDHDTLTGLAKRMSSEELICNIDSLQAHIGSLRDGRDPKTSAELCIIGLCEPNLSDDLDNMKKRIAKLEEAFSGGAFPEPKPKQEKVSPEQRTEEIIQSVSCEDNIIRENDDKISESANEEQLAEDSSSITSSTDNVWRDILGVLKSTMQLGQYNIIGNEMMAKGTLSGNMLSVSVPNAFVKGQLEQAQAMDCIKKATEKVTGRPIAVKILENKAEPAANPDKLGSLSKFGNVKFE